MPNARAAWLVGAVLSACLPGAARAQPPRVLVLDTNVKGNAPADAGEALSNAVAAQLQKDGAFRVTTLRTAREVVEQQKRLQEAGCTGDGCSLELAHALTASEIFQPMLASTDDGWLVSLARTDVARGESRGLAQRRIPARMNPLLDAVPGLVREVLGRADTQAPPVQGLITVAAANAPRDGRARVVVLPFAQSGGGAELEPLRRGLMDMVGTDLSQCASVRVLERAELEAVMAELKLQRTAAFDVSSAQQVGRLLGAQLLVLGSFMDVLGTFRLDARVVRVETGEVLAAHGVTGRKEDFVDLQRRLVAGLVPGMGIPTQPAEREMLAQRAQGTLTDAVEYARAADASSAGDVVTARALAGKVLARVPGMAAAGRLLAASPAERAR